MQNTERATLFEIDPLTDSRWMDFVEAHSQGSVFHGTGWLRALAMTYGYRPVAFTTTPPGEPLSNAIVFCEIKSWLTGNRFVSLPFTDYCAPLVNDCTEVRALLSGLRTHPRLTQARFAEIRGGADFLTSACSDLCEITAHYVHHKLSLRPTTDEIFRGFHPSCIRRAIRRAEKEGVRVECGRSDALVSSFYRLLVQTRQRHGVPPQTLTWFKNLVSAMGEQLCIRVAFIGSRAIAAIITLTANQSMTYKYGASDERFHNIGAVPLTMWNAISEARATNLTVFDFGRTDLEDVGLIQFKERFNALDTPLLYHRMWIQQHPTPNRRKWPESAMVRKMSRRIPGPILEVIGRLLYRHVG